MNLLVSGCLMGVNCRYNGSGRPEEWLQELMNTHTLIPVCPEQLGGMATPREPSERVGKQVIDCKGEDVTPAFLRGAEEALKLAKLYHCEYAILKERSPSCGSDGIYDGTFSGKVVPGEGVTAEQLRIHGIKVIGERAVRDFLL